jgi:hypothetical protein
MSYLTALMLILVMSVSSKLLAQESRSLSVKQVISSVETDSDFKFLYREALVAGKKVAVNTFPPKPEDLKTLLNPVGIEVRIDSVRKQIFLFELKSEQAENRQNKRIEISVADASTGELLPGATISWKTKSGDIRGVVTDRNGSVVIHDLAFNLSSQNVTVRYVGYSTEKITLNKQLENDDITVRLNQEMIFGNEIMIHSAGMFAPADSLFDGVLRYGKFNPMGESNTLRMLQQLPSVQQTQAISSGLHVRSAPPDGFVVILDEVPIYSHTHLFGLVDSFNDDAMLSTGFFYNATPARYLSGSGGTLSLNTRSGSRQQIKTGLGLSNTAVSATFEGPIADGKGSWMISGRHSYMNAINWLGNEDLVGWGLDVGRENSLDSDQTDLTQNQLISANDYEASFYDLHAKGLYEFSNQSLLQLSFYTGGDDNEQRYERFRNTGQPGRFNRRFEQTEEVSSNNWSNNAMSLSYMGDIGSDKKWFSTITVGISDFSADFKKTDVLFDRPGAGGNENERDVEPGLFLNESDIVDVMGKLELKRNAGVGNEFVLGSEIHSYDVNYRESTSEAGGFDVSYDPTAIRADLFGEYDLRWKNVNLRSGGRLHYYSPGNQVFASPSLHARWDILKDVNLSAGYSLTHQFLNRVSIRNLQISDIWMLADEEQPVTSVHHSSAGISWIPFRGHQLKIEGYLKSYDHLRQHSLTTQTLQTTLEDNRPVFYDNTGFGRGLEVMLRQQFYPIAFTHSYTWSRMSLENEILQNGRKIDAEWDRRHQYSLTMEAALGWNWNLTTSMHWATGTPDYSTLEAVAREERLPNTFRVDAGLRWAGTLSGAKTSVLFSVYNVLNQKNVWYRERKLVLTDGLSSRGLEPVLADVYDLGFQPSFRFQVGF